MSSSFFRFVRRLLTILGAIAFLAFIVSMLFTVTESATAFRVLKISGIILFFIELILFVGWLFYTTQVERESYRKWEYVFVLLSGIVSLIGFVGLLFTWSDSSVWTAISALLVGLGLLMLTSGWLSMERDNPSLKSDS